MGFKYFPRLQQQVGRLPLGNELVDLTKFLLVSPRKFHPEFYNQEFRFFVKCWGDFQIIHHSWT